MPENKQIGVADEAKEMIQTFEATAREELMLIAELIMTDEDAAHAVRMGGVEELGDGAYAVLAQGCTVALRPGITGETHNADKLDLYRRGMAGPAIFVNTVECVVSENREETQEAVLAEIGDQLAAHGVTNA